MRLPRARDRPDQGPGRMTDPMTETEPEAQTLQTKTVQKADGPLLVLDMHRVPAKDMALRLPAWLLARASGSAARRRLSLSLWIAQAMLQLAIHDDATLILPEREVR